MQSSPDGAASTPRRSSGALAALAALAVTLLAIDHRQPEHRRSVAIGASSFAGLLLRWWRGRPQVSLASLRGAALHHRSLAALSAIALVWACLKYQQLLWRAGVSSGVLRDTPKDLRGVV